MISTMNPMKPRTPLPPAINTQKLRPSRQSITPSIPLNITTSNLNQIQPLGIQAHQHQFSLDPSWLSGPLSAGSESLLTPTSASFSPPPTSPSSFGDPASALAQLCPQLQSSTPASPPTSLAKNNHTTNMDMTMTVDGAACALPAPGGLCVSASPDHNASLTSPGIAADIGANFRLEQILAGLSTGDVSPSPGGSGNGVGRMSLRTTEQPITTASNIGLRTPLEIPKVSIQGATNVQPSGISPMDQALDPLVGLSNHSRAMQGNGISAIPSPHPDDKSWLKMGGLDALLGAQNLNTSFQGNPTSGAMSISTNLATSHQATGTSIAATQAIVQLPTPGSSLPSSATLSTPTPPIPATDSSSVPMLKTRARSNSVHTKRRSMTSPIHQSTASVPTTPVDVPPDALRFLDMRVRASQSHSPQFQNRPVPQSTAAVTAAASAMVAENALSGLGGLQKQDNVRAVGNGLSIQTNFTAPMQGQPIQSQPTLPSNAPNSMRVQNGGLQIAQQPRPNQLGNMITSQGPTLSPANTPSVQPVAAGTGPQFPVPNMSTPVLPSSNVPVRSNVNTQMSRAATAPQLVRHPSPSGPMVSPGKIMGASTPPRQFPHSVHGRITPTRQVQQPVSRPSLYIPDNMMQMSSMQTSSVGFPVTGFHPYASPVSPMGYSRGYSRPRAVHPGSYAPYQMMYNQYSGSNPYYGHPFIGHPSQARYGGQFPPTPADLYAWPNLPKPDEPPPHPDEFNERGDDPPKKAKSSTASPATGSKGSSSTKDGSAASGPDFSSQGSIMSRYIQPPDVVAQASTGISAIPPVTG